MALAAPRRTPETFQLSPIKAIEMAAARIPGAISLAQGIPSFNTPPEITNFVIDKVRSGACDKYSLPIGLQELREEISISLARDGLSYDPDTEILITVGSIEGISAALLALTEPGDEVLIPSPTYSSYLAALAVCRARPKFIELDEENGFDFDLQILQDALSRKCRALLYCTPNNPTGTLFSESLTREMLRITEESNTYIIVDEVYKDFYYGDEKHFSPAQVESARGRIIRVCSFSKAYAMTGWRVGFIAADRNIVSHILKYHDALVNCAPVVSQYAALAALRYGESFLINFVSEYRKRRDYAIQRLDNLSLFLDYQIPRATYFVFPRLKDSVGLAYDSSQFAYDLLEKAHVAVVPGSAFGPSGESHIRINFGRDEEDLRVGLERLSDYLTRRPPRTLPAQGEIKRPQAGSWTLHSVLRTGAKHMLGFFARAYLQRVRPRIIGISGIRGKTFMKRSFVDLLSLTASSRASRLSYNTPLGLPLAVLGIEAPHSNRDKVLLPFRAIRAVLFPSREDFLVLEYGPSNQQEADWLLSIARPEYLFLSPLNSPDKPSELSSALLGVRTLVEAMDQTRVFYPINETLLEIVGCASLPASQAVSPTSREDLSIEGITSPQGREFVGESAELALGASLRLAQELTIPTDAVRSFLSSH